MLDSSSDLIKRAWNVALFGAACLKANEAGQKPRQTRAFLHPVEPAKLCWLSKWKNQKDAQISLADVSVEAPDSLEVFAKSGRHHPLILKNQKRRLILGFETTKERKAFIVVAELIRSAHGLPR